jgi:hypothetical protein
MKKILLFLATVCFSLSGWGQLTEYNDMGNTFEFGSGQDPEFIAFNGKLYFISDFNGDNKEYIMSIDGNNDLTMVYDPSSGVGSDQWDIQALTVYDNQLYFALANLTANPGNYFLYRLNGGIGEVISPSALVSDPYDARMIVYNDVLYFAGRENASIPEVGLISYSPSDGFTQVNTTVSGEDFSPSRFIVSTNNSLYFFEEFTDFPSPGYSLYNLDTNSGSTTLSTIGSTWYGDGFNAPVISVFIDKLIIISNIASNGTGGVYELSSSNVLSQINGLIGVSSFSFKNAVNYNTGGIVYNNKLALFRASNSTVNTTDFVDDRLVILSGDGSFVEYDLQTLDGAGFYGVENDALIFFATESGGEKIYELRETTNNVFPTVRAILPSSTQDISPLFGKPFNNRLYYYGNPINASDGGLRTLNYYDTRILDYGPIISNQEELDFFGGLGFRTILQTMSIQDNAGGGTLVNDLSPLSSLEQADYISIAYTGIQNLSGLENLEQVYRFFDIQDNNQLTTLNGLNTNIIFDTETPAIFQNSNLLNFCALQPWAASADPSFSSDWAPTDNGYNPTWVDLQNPTSCKNETLGVDNFESANLEEKITLFPNPVNDILNIESEFIGDYQVFDINSRIIGYGKILFGINKIDTSLFESGLYILKISKNRETFVVKIIKE